MIGDRLLHAVATITTALLAIILIGGSVGLALEGRDVPAWLIGFDGSIVLGAFANGAFFAVLRMGEPTNEGLADMRSKYHELAMATATETTPAQGKPAD